jgi:lactate permease
MFHQQLTPVANSLGLSCLVAAIPVLTVLLLLGVLRRPAWQAASAGLLLALIIAVVPWQMPITLAVQSVLNGATFALWPMMWIVINGLLLYNIAVHSGRFDALRTWVLQHLPNDRRVVLVVMGFCFGAMLEAITGFGAPVAVTAALLILVGFPALEAVIFVLIFNTAPVAFGALGNPITVLSAVTGLPAAAMGAMVGRQLPLIATILPLYVIALYGGWRSVRALWPVLLVAGASFGIAQFVTANYINYLLTDVFSSLSSLLVTLLFLRVWHPAPDPAFMIDRAALTSGTAPSNVPAWQGWLPWLTLSIIVTLWIYCKVPADLAAQYLLADARQGHLHHAVQRQAVRGDLELPAARYRHGHSRFVPGHGAVASSAAGGVPALPGTDAAPGLAAGHSRVADCWPGLFDELLGPGLHLG